MIRNKQIKNNPTAKIIEETNKLDIIRFNIINADTSHTNLELDNEYH